HDALPISKYRVGSRASIIPPVQAQSAGDQNTSLVLGNQFCEATKPGRLPIRTLCGSKAPFGAPVVPDVYSKMAGSVARVITCLHAPGWRARRLRQGMTR